MDKLSRKRQSVPIGKKLEIIRAIEQGRSQVDLSRELNLPKSTIATIWGNRERIMVEGTSGTVESSRKRFRTAQHSDVEEALLKWFTAQKLVNIPINGPILIAKAQQFAAELQVPDFKCSGGWLDRFKTRHGIVFGKISGEAASVDKQVTTTWLKDTWPREVAGFIPRDVYNADETGLFFKLTPDKTFRFRGEKCVGGKCSKERITVLVCSNMDGSDKRKLLVIGKFKKPRCFKNIRTLPVNYQANKRAWMSSVIFQAELLAWEKELARQKRKILLVIDNCPAHPRLNLSSIKLLFLPPNTTSELQPMDQGVIRSLKCHFGRFLVLHFIEQIEQKQTQNVSLLDAINIVHRAWMCVKPETVANCFAHAGLVIPNVQQIEFEEEDDLPLNLWIERNNILQVNREELPIEVIQELNDVINLEIAVTETLDNASIVESVLSEKSQDDDEVETEEIDEQETVVPSTAETINMAKGISCFLRSVENVPDSVWNSFAEVEGFLLTTKLKKKTVQTKISQYFK